MKKEDIMSNLSKSKTQARQIHPNAMVVPYTKAVKALNRMSDINHSDLSMKERYELVCNEYMHEFADKHGYDTQKSYWIGEDVGGVADFSFYVADMVTIRYDLDNDIPVEMFEEWCEYSLACHEFGIAVPNYENWCKGCPRLSSDDFGKLLDLKSSLKGQTIKF